MTRGDALPRAHGGADRRPRLLVIDDGAEYARVVSEHLEEFELVHPDGPGGDGPARIADGPTALDWLDGQVDQVDAVLLDVHFDVPEDRLLALEPPASPRRTRRFQGVAILRHLRRRFPALPVVLLTSLEDLSLVDVDGELARQSMTYFLDGDDLDTLRIRIHAALGHRRAALADGDVLWGADTTMQALRRRLEVLARSSMPIIVEGETGVGKSYLAEHFVHRASGREGPFVTLDLATVPTELVPAHLFGARRGAYTGAHEDRKGVFELAQGGTLFIDEVQNIPMELQKQLLVVLQDRRVRPLGASQQLDVDVKVVAGSNEPLAEAVAAGRFRQDLYMRLGPATRIRVPPLRERGGDLDFFLRRFVAQSAASADNRPLARQVAEAVGVGSDDPMEVRIGREGGDDAPGLVLVLPRPAWEQLTAHRWPGNVRELGMVVHNLVTFTLVAAVDALEQGLSVSSPRLQVDPGLVGQLLAATAGSEHDVPDDSERIGITLAQAPTLNAVANDVERQYFRALFFRTRGDFATMAEILLGDPGKARAVRLRFNQLGLKVRELKAG